MLGFIIPTTRFRGRTTHHKSARRAEDHFHSNRSHGVGTGGAVHLEGGRSGGDRAKVITHHHG